MARKHLREIAEQVQEGSYSEENMSDNEEDESQSLLQFLNSPLPSLTSDNLTTIDLNALSNEPFTTTGAEPLAKSRKINNVQTRKNVNTTDIQMETAKTKRWTWTDDMIEVLLHNISAYKSTKEYEGIDFESDLVQYYGDIRKMMAETHPEEDFGLAEVMVQNTDTMTKSELLMYKRKIERLEKLRKEGYKRIKNKIKELRRGYKKAIDSGTRSGSGRLIQENFEILKEIWSGCPAVTSLASSLSSMQSSSNEQHDPYETQSQSYEQTGDESVSDGRESNVGCLDETESLENNTGDNAKGGVHNKYKDNKREKLQKKLSAHQRDMMYIEIAREELRLKEAQIDMMKKSFEQTDSAINAMAKSMTAIGNGLKDGLATLAQSFLQSQQMASYPYQAPPMFNVISAPVSSHVATTQIQNSSFGNEKTN